MSFDEEHLKIYNELLKKTKEIDERAEKDKTYKGLDSPYDLESKQAYREFREKQIALKKEYGIPDKE